MRSIRSIFVLLILLVGGCLILIQFSDVFTNASDVEDKGVVSNVPKLQSNQQDKATAEILTGELFGLMKEHSNEVLRKYGQPVRKDLSAYGYTWWIYTDHKSEYIQVGIKDDHVQTIYAIGDSVPTGPFTIGTPYSEIEKQFPINDKVTYQTGLSTYSFLLKQTDLNMSPLIKIADDLFVQAYFDTVTEELSSIRILTSDILLTQRFYEMEYRGSLNKEIKLSQAEWEEIEQGMERQVLEITNIIRKRHKVPALAIEQDVAEVAFMHSKDMSENDYFSHDRPDGTGLKERLAEKSIAYASAGENIAAQYSDAPAAVEGWLNSAGHREALLHSGYSHLGVGVYQLYYTQNFISK